MGGPAAQAAHALVLLCGLRCLQQACGGASGVLPQRQLLQDTSRTMGFERFKEVFDCYLALDITAYADLMQIFRRHFFQHSSHRPVPLPFATFGVLGGCSPGQHSAAWPAVPPHHRCGRVQGGQAGHDGWFVRGVPTPQRVRTSRAWSSTTPVSLSRGVCIWTSTRCTRTP